MWEPLHEWTDEELRSLDEEFADGPFAVTKEPAQTAAEVRAEEALDRTRHIEELERYRAAIGVVLVYTIATFMTADH